MTTLTVADRSIRLPAAIKSTRPWVNDRASRSWRAGLSAAGPAIRLGPTGHHPLRGRVTGDSVPSRVLEVPGRMRVAIYARVSTRDKDQNPETQLRPLREHLGGLGNVQFVGEFVDTASADDLRGRRDWRRLLELVRRRRVDVIIVWRLDRAFRSVVDGATTLETLRSCSCGHSVAPRALDRHHNRVWRGPLPHHHRLGDVGEGDHARADQGRHGARPGRGQAGRPPAPDPATDRTLPVGQGGPGLELGHLTRTEAALKLRVRRTTLVAALKKLPKGGLCSAPPDEMRSVS